jgi:hypothetical protein
VPDTPVSSHQTTSPSAAERRGPSLTAAAGDLLALPFTLAWKVLPDNLVALALAGGALAIAGVVEWPAVAAGGLGYAALRRWRRPSATGPSAR